MPEENSDIELSLDQKSLTKIGIAVAVAFAILTIITISAYNFAKSKSGTVVLPGGTTYLGPSPTQAAAPTTAAPPPGQPLKFNVTSSTPWTEFKSKVFGYSFSYPNSLSLIIFPNDETDSVAISWGNIPPQNNIMIRVADLNKTESEMAKYIGQPKIEYAKNWWRQFSGLKGVKSVEKFTNSKGMTGYKCKFINLSNETPNDDVFFEIDGKPNLMVRFGNGVLDSAVFNRIIDSFSWPAKTG